MLESVTLDDLTGLWAEFEARVRYELLLLFRMPLSEVKMRFGDLGLRFDRDEQSGLPFGLLHTSGRLINLRKKAVARAMVELGLLSNKTARNKRRTRASEGRLEDAILQLESDKRLMIVDRVMQYGIEDVLFANQGDDLGWEAFIARLIKASSATEILEFVSEEFTNFCELTSPAAAGLSAAKGARRVFAPYWFAMFLAARHVWLLPKTCLASLHRAYPRRWMPLLPLLATPPECKDIAVKVLTLFDGTKETQRNCPVVFALSALSSTMWSSRRFCPWPLHELRLQFKASGNLGVATTGSINRVYDFLAKEFDVDIANRLDSGVYYGKKKHFTAGRPFIWCFTPTPHNTRLLKRCLGEDVLIVPQFIRDVAEELIFVVNQLTVKDLTGVIDALDLWLIFLMSLNPSDAPSSLREINRHVHVNSLNDEDPTFVNFLKKHFYSKGKDIALKAVGQLHHAWQLCATKDGHHHLSNPFDTKIDKPFKYKQRAARTARPVLEKRVVDKLFEINCRNDFELARNLGDRHYRTLKHPVKGGSQQGVLAGCSNLYRRNYVDGNAPEDRTLVRQWRGRRASLGPRESDDVRKLGARRHKRSD